MYHKIHLHGIAGRAAWHILVRGYAGHFVKRDMKFSVLV